MNQEILKNITNQDYNTIANRIQNGLERKIKETNSKGVIFGLSGGIDSTVIAVSYTHLTLPTILIV